MRRMVRVFVPRIVVGGAHSKTVQFVRSAHTACADHGEPRSRAEWQLREAAYDHLEPLLRKRECRPQGDQCATVAHRYRLNPMTSH